MMTPEIILLSTCIVALFVLIALTAYTIHRDTTKMSNNFQLQITAAQSSQRPDIHKMAYSDLMKIVNETIDYYTVQNLAVKTLASKSSEEISIQLDEIAADIATKVKISVSPQVSNCITAYVTDDFYDRYIINSVRLLLVAHIEREKRNTRRGTPMGNNNNNHNNRGNGKPNTNNDNRKK